MHDKRGVYLLIRLVQKQVLKLLGSQEVALWLICSIKFTSPCLPLQTMVYPCKYLRSLVHIWSHSFFPFSDPVFSSYCFNTNIAVFISFWSSLLLCSPCSYKLVGVFVLDCQILCVLRACIVSTEKTCYTHRKQFWLLYFG